MHGRLLVLAALAVAALTAPAPRLAAQIQVPPDFEALALPGAFPFSTALAFAPDGTLFLVRKNGIVRVFDASQQLQAAPFIDLVDEVNSNHDRGMLSLALHPGFLPDGGPTSWVYLAYTVSPVPGLDTTYNQNQQYSFSRLTRYRAVTSGTSIVADTDSRQVLLGNQLPDGSVPDCITSLHASHSNGTLRFAPDGTLMFSVGDGAHFDLIDTGGNDDAGFDDVIHPVTLLKGPTPKVQDNGAFRSQDLRSLSGKLLRLDPETGFGLPSNPFFDGDPASHASRVWALGLRNPFRMAHVPGTGGSDPAEGQPGIWVLGDVGAATWEELNVCTAAGDNFGWPCTEGQLPAAGFSTYNPADPEVLDCFTSAAGTPRPPRLAWNHNDPALMTPAVHVDELGQPLPGLTGSCAIGGAFYAGGGYPPEFEGRLFFADWLQEWIRTAELDENYNIVAVRDFATGVQNICHIERHPLHGDLYALDSTNGIVYRLRYALDNATPVPVAAAVSPAVGPAPLLVSFSSAGSLDPDGDALDFDWDFGDGTPHGTEAEVQHAFEADGVYRVTLTASDQFGLSASTSVMVFVGDAPVGLSLLSPAQGAVFLSPTTLQLDGVAASVDGGPLTYAWSVDLTHDAHTHPAFFTSDQQQAEFAVDLEDHGDGVFYFKVNLTVTNQSGLSASAHVFVYPESMIGDVTGTAGLIAKIDELVPPFPLGGGNLDLEVVRDAVEPPLGSGVLATQYATYHQGQQGDDDWIGLELTGEPDPHERFVSLRFQEGIHSNAGGWFEDLSVEVREGGVWTPVDNLVVTPVYPSGFAEQPLFDGTSFDVYELRFDPQAGDAIRLRGNPGGTAGYVSCGELRARRVREPPHLPYADIGAAAEIIAQVFSLSPPLPMGAGNKNPETIRNGTWPAFGSSSVFAQFDTFHFGDQGSSDWIGYDFGDTRTLARVVFQEGQHFADGGAFASVALEVQATPFGPWTPVSGATITPPYGGLDGESYETYAFDFPPVLARAMRLHGVPAGSRRYISVGELQALGPELDHGCGFSSYGEPVGAQTLSLESPTPAALGLPIVVRASGALPNTPGMLGIALAPAALPLKGGVLLLNDATLLQVALAYDLTGGFKLSTQLPNNPALVGFHIYLQAFAFSQDAPYAVRFSNGLDLSFCTW